MSTMTYRLREARAGFALSVLALGIALAAHRRR